MTGVKVLQCIISEAGFPIFNDSLKTLTIETSKPSSKTPHYRKSFESQKAWMNKTLYCVIKERLKLHQQVKKQTLNCILREKYKTFTN